MDTDRSLLRRLLTAALVLFLIFGFTVTPIAAADADAKMGYMYNIHTTPAPELFEHYSKAVAAASKNGVLYKDLAASSATLDEYIIVTADDIIDFLYAHPEITECIINGEMYTAYYIIHYMESHPDFTAVAPSSLFGDDHTEDISGMYVTVTADDVTDYLHAHPEFKGGSVDGHSFTPDDIIDYLQNHPDFAAGIYLVSESDYDDYDSESDCDLKPFGVVDMLLGSLLPQLITGAIALIVIGVLDVVDDVYLTNLILTAAFYTGLGIGLAVASIMIIVDIVFLVIALCDNGWEQVLVLLVLFATWPMIRADRRRMHAKTS